jgi:hypothetical protein
MKVCAVPKVHSHTRRRVAGYTLNAAVCIDQEVEWGVQPALILLCGVPGIAVRFQVYQALCAIPTEPTLHIPIVTGH